MLQSLDNLITLSCSAFLVDLLSILVSHTFKRPQPAKADICALGACDATAVQLYGEAVSGLEGHTFGC